MLRTTLAALLLVSMTSLGWSQDRSAGVFVIQAQKDAESDVEVELLIRKLVGWADVESRDAVEVRLFQPGRYWVGLHCVEVDAALLSQLKLPANNGIVIRKVFDKTPAAKSGLEVHDLLLKAGAVKLKSVANLIQAVKQAETKTLTFEVVRKGKTLKIDVTPSERPKEFRVDVESNGLARKVRLADPRLQRHTLKLLGVGPGIVINRHTKELRIGVTKTGKGPVKITVSKDGKTWTATDKDIDRLPEEIRKTVREHLKNIETVKPRKGASGAIHLEFRTVPGGHVANDRAVKWMHAIQLPARTENDNTGKRLDSIEKKLDRLQKSIDALVNQKK